MAHYFRVAAVLCVTLFALFLTACTASGGEETVGSVFQEKKTISTESSDSTDTTDTPLSSQSSTESSDDQSDASSAKDTDSYDGGSVKPTVSCPSTHPVLDTWGNCHSCDEYNAISTEDQESCERICNGKNGTTKRVNDFYSCKLETCPNDRPLMDIWGDCKSCKYDGPVRDVTNCSKCSNRKVQDGYCVIANCEGRPLLDNEGFCYPCSTSLSVQTVTGECTSKCPNRREGGSWSDGSGSNKSEGAFCYYDSEGSE